MHPKRRAPSERDAKLAELVSEANWIIEGAHYKWLKPSFERCDLIIVMKTPVWRRDLIILRRYLAWRRTVRLSLVDTWTSLGYLIKDFQYNHSYDRNELERARKLLKPFSDKLIDSRKLAGVLS